MTRTPRAVALISSGLDSSVAMAMAIRSGIPVILGITIDYCQQAARVERERAALICKHFGVKHRTISLPWFSELSHCGALLGDRQIPNIHADSLGDGNITAESAKAVWVPNRNGILIEVAAAFAEDLGATDIIVGFNREEASTFPDNSAQYLNAINQALTFSTSTHVQLNSPTLELTKNEIVSHARAVDFPLHLVWSCYRSGTSMCGKCESCQRLKRALAQNGVRTDGYFENTL